MACAVSPVVAITVVDDEEDEEIFHSAEDTPDESGHDAPAPPLSREDQVTAITSLIDFYFGDENFARDRFLRTKAREDPEGWLKIELIASFKRVRKLTGELTADQSVLIESARESEVVVFDEANGKIKRKHALPINPREALYFTAVIENLPADATVEAVETLCTEAGFKPDKVLIAINPRAKIDVTADTRQLVEEECKSSKVKPHPMFDPDSVMARPKPTAPIALVTFNSVDRCGDACGSLSGTRGDWRTGVLAAPLCKKDKRARRKKKRNGEENGWSDYSGTEGSDASAMSDAERGMPRPPRPLASCSPRQGRAMAARSPLGRENVREYHSSPNHSPMNSPSPNRRRDLRRPRPQLLDSKSPGPGGDKWRARSASPSWRPSIVPRSESPSMRGFDGVKRMPLGPDGSPGFSRGRGKPLSKEI